MLQNTVLIWNTILHTSSKYKMRFLLNFEIYPGMNISTLKLTLIQITTQQNPYTINHISTQRTSKRNTHIKLVKKPGSAVHLISIAFRALRKAIYLLNGAKKKKTPTYKLTKNHRPSHIPPDGCRKASQASHSSPPVAPALHPVHRDLKSQHHANKTTKAGEWLKSQVIKYRQTAETAEPGVRENRIPAAHSASLPFHSTRRKVPLRSYPHTSDWSLSSTASEVDLVATAQ